MRAGALPLLLLAAAVLLLDQLPRSHGHAYLMVRLADLARPMHDAPDVHMPA